MQPTGKATSPTSSSQFSPNGSEEADLPPSQPLSTYIFQLCGAVNTKAVCQHCSQNRRAGRGGKCARAGGSNYVMLQQIEKIVVPLPESTFNQPILHHSLKYRMSYSRCRFQRERNRRGGRTKHSRDGNLETRAQKCRRGFGAAHAQRISLSRSHAVYTFMYNICAKPTRICKMRLDFHLVTLLSMCASCGAHAHKHRSKSLPAGMTGQEKYALSNNVIKRPARAGLFA